MPCHTRMKTLRSQGLLWLYLLGLALMVTSLEPGFLDFDNLPDTNFTCVGKVIGGYYADLETACQMFHVCTIGQMDEPMDIRFLCLNGTVFDQETRVCERIDEVDCAKSERFYSLNLELYGNTQPPILEDSIETEAPETLKSPSSTTTTTTTPKPTKPKTTRQSFIITTTPKPPVTTITDKILNFQGSNSADIRFNPEEINISLNAGAPPSIRPKPISFQQQSFSDTNKRIIVTTHTTVYKTENSQPTPITKISTTQKPKPSSYHNEEEDEEDDTYHPTDFNYFQTERDTESYQYRSNSPPNFRPSSRDEYKPSTYRTIYHPTTPSPLKVSYNHRGPTTYRNLAYTAPLKPSQPYILHTEKPPRIQLPLPQIPTISPLTFSSPAPFSLNRHIETKRYTDHHQPPRIVISASASVSDATGRKFNYSLGTIGDSRFFGQPPPSYDDYKEGDVGLDPFFHDVPKLRRLKRNFIVRRRYRRSLNKRKKRNIEDEAKQLIANSTKFGEVQSEKEAIEVLRFLFNWYNSHEKTMKAKNISIPIKSETITEINDELTSQNSDNDYVYDEELDGEFDGKFNVSEDVISVTENKTKKETTTTTTTTENLNLPIYDYVDDNYEPETYNVTDYEYEDKKEIIPSSTQGYDTVLKILGITTNKPRARSLIETPVEVLTEATKETGGDLIEVTHEEDYYEVPTERRDVESRKGEENSKVEDIEYYDYNEDNLVTNKPENSEKLEKEAEIKRDNDLLNSETPSDAEYITTEAYKEVVLTTEDKSKIETMDNNPETTISYPDFTTIAPTTITESLTEVPEPTYPEDYPEYQEEQTSNPEIQTTYSEEQTEEITTEYQTYENRKEHNGALTTEMFKTSVVMPEETVTSTETTTEEVKSSVVTPKETMASTEPTTEEVKTSTTEDSQVLTTELYTTVAYQKFVEEIEKTTKSIADYKSEAEVVTVVSTPVVNTESTLKESVGKTVASTPSFEETTTEATSVESVSTTRKNSYRGRHRFSSYNNSRKSSKRKPSITEEIVDVIKTKMDKVDKSRRGRKKIEFNINAYTANLAYRRKNSEEEVSVTAPSFSKSANPTVAKQPKDYLVTTPITKSENSKQNSDQSYIFNCFNKRINRFYSDPRDCRLFHYCTQGYTKTQLLDMKFVCDLGTFFDEEKLICTNDKPQRCV